jgi:HD-GYP domain-containing protein (c-di-GMP phosphodiesterase class II)
VALICVLGAISTGLAVFSIWVMPARIRARLKQSAKAFGRAIELRFPNHAGHTGRVLELSLGCAARLGLSRSAQERLELAAQLRDIGLCAVPYRLGNSLHTGECTEDDLKAYERHPEISAAMLDQVPTLSHLADVVRAHHEGYSPNADSPVESRILSAAADYAWLERIHGSESAIAEVKSLSEVRYDPRVVGALEEVLRSPRAAGPSTEAAVA